MVGSSTKLITDNATITTKEVEKRLGISHRNQKLHQPQHQRLLLLLLQLPQLLPLDPILSVEEEVWEACLDKFRPESL